MSSRPLRRPPRGAPRYGYVASVRPPRSCPRAGFVAPRSLRPVAPNEEFVVSTLPRSGRPDHGFVVCTPLISGRPDIEPVRHPARREVSSAPCAPAFRFPESAGLAAPPGLPDDAAGSIHGPRSRAARPISRLPARSPRPHCTGSRAGSGSPPGFPVVEPSLRAVHPHNPTASPPVSRTVKGPRCTGHPHAGATCAPVARNTHALRRTGRSSCGASARIPRLPGGRPRLHCADPAAGRRLRDGCPFDGARLTARMPMLEALRSIRSPVRRGSLATRSPE